MSTYILNNHDRISIARRPVTVSVSGGGPPGQVLLGTSGAASDQEVRHPRPDVMILPNVTQPVTRPMVVRVLPGQGCTVFPDGTVVSVTLRTDRTRDADEDVVVVQSIDVSGLFHRDLVEVGVDGARLSVAALNAVVDSPLPPLPAAARAASRAHLGADRLTDAVDVVIAVDTSASMAPLLADGTVEAAVDVLAGLSDVVGWGRSLTVHLLGERAERLPDVPAADLAAATVAAVGRFGLGCGCRTSSPESAGSAPSVTFVVTDAVPADVEALRAGQGPDTVRHLLLLGQAVTRQPRRGDMPVTVIPAPPSGVQAGDHLMSAPGLLAGVMASLLAGLGPDGRRGYGQVPA